MRRVGLPDTLSYHRLLGTFRPGPDPPSPIAHRTLDRLRDSGEAGEAGEAGDGFDGDPGR